MKPGKLMLISFLVIFVFGVVEAFTTLPHAPLVSRPPMTSTSSSSKQQQGGVQSFPSHQKTKQSGLFTKTTTTTTTTTTCLQATPIPSAITNANVPTELNVVLVVSSIAILVGYHLNLFRKEFKSENYSGGANKTWRQYQADTREDWARYVRETEGWLYAIQSLRNAITAQTFLATTVLSLLTLITGRIWDILRSASNTSERRLLTIQLTCIAMTMLVSAYQFLQGVRLMTHAGFMFPVKKNDTKVDNIMRQTQNCQWLGLRWMYISLGPIAWVVGGSRAFFIAAVTLLQFFRSIDKKPEGLGYEEFQGSAI